MSSAGITAGLALGHPQVLEAGSLAGEAIAVNHLLGEAAEDETRWWQACLLAGNDQAGELRERAAAGDEHARRQLAGWLSDRLRAEEAVGVVRPLADAGDGVAELWLARWLADGDHLDELRQRVSRGSCHAPRELAGRLADHDMLGELRGRASASDGHHALRALARALAERGRHDELRDLAVAADRDRRLLILGAAAGANLAGLRGLRVLRVLAGLGSKTGRAGLARRLLREGRLDELRERAESGDVYAQAWLSGSPASLQPEIVIWRRNCEDRSTVSLKLCLQPRC